MGGGSGKSDPALSLRVGTRPRLSMWKWEMPDSGKIESVLRCPVFFIEKTLDMLILSGALKLAGSVKYDDFNQPQLWRNH